MQLQKRFRGSNGCFHYHVSDHFCDGGLGTKEADDLLPYLWRLAELANEMSNERDDQLWDKVQKQQGDMPNQYLMGQKFNRLMTVSANFKDELGNATKITKDCWTNF